MIIWNPRVQKAHSYHHHFHWLHRSLDIAAQVNINASHRCYHSYVLLYVNDFGSDLFPVQETTACGEIERRPTNVLMEMQRTDPAAARYPEPTDPPAVRYPEFEPGRLGLQQRLGWALQVCSNGHYRQRAKLFVADSQRRPVTASDKYCSSRCTCTLSIAALSPLAASLPLSLLSSLPLSPRSSLSSSLPSSLLSTHPCCTLHSGLARLTCGCVD